MGLQRRLQLVSHDNENQWMQAAIKVAFATSDMKQVDQHFGASRSFAVYLIDPEQVRFVEACAFDCPNMDSNEDKLVAKIAALAGCAAVYSQAVGASAISQLKANGIQPVKVLPGTLISELIASLQEELRQGPSRWLARAVENAQSTTQPATRVRRFDAMEAAGWVG